MPPATAAPASPKAMSLAVDWGVHVTEQVRRLPVDAQSDLAGPSCSTMLAGDACPVLVAKGKDEALRRDQVESGPPPLRTSVADAPERWRP